MSDEGRSRAVRVVWVAQPAWGCSSGVDAVRGELDGWQGSVAALLDVVARDGRAALALPASPLDITVVVYSADASVVQCIVAVVQRPGGRTAR